MVDTFLGGMNNGRGERLKMKFPPYINIDPMPPKRSTPPIAFAPNPQKDR